MTDTELLSGRFLPCCDENKENPLTIQVRKLYDNNRYVGAVADCSACKRTEVFKCEWDADLLEQAIAAWNARQSNQLKEAIHEAKEIYTGMQGFKPETAPEAYQQRILKQMYEALTRHLTKGDSDGF